jgi:hypothetical protein
MSHNNTPYDEYFIQIGNATYDKLIHVPTGAWRWIRYLEDDFRGSRLDAIKVEIEDEICSCLKCIARRILKDSESDK